MAWTDWKNVPDNSVVTASASDVLTGKVIVDANGVKISGTMLNQTNNTGTVGLAWAGSTAGSADGGSGWTQAGNQLRIPIPKGYYGSSTYSSWSCSGLVLNDFQNKLGITASKIVRGQSICGINGTGGGVKYFNKTCEISEGTWSGVTLSNSSYVVPTSASKDSTFTYYHNLNLNISKIQYISWHIIETTNRIRVPRGISGTSTAYAYQSRYGFGQGRSDFVNGGDFVYSSVFFDSAPAGAGSSWATAQLFVYSNHLYVCFSNNGLNVPLAIKSTTPKFEFTIIYE